MSEQDRIERLVNKEVALASEILERDPTFDNLVDAAATIVNAARRIAPDGYRIRIERGYISNFENAERLSMGRRG